MQPPKLRATLEAFLAEGEVLDARAAGGADVDYLSILTKYATPECAAIFQGLYDAFGDGDGENENSEAVDIISVSENGTSGTTVTRGSDGIDESQHWVLRNNTWKFTCEGIFDQTAEAEPTAEVQTTIAEPTITYPDNPALGSFCPHAI